MLSFPTTAYTNYANNFEQSGTHDFQNLKVRDLNLVLFSLDATFYIIRLLLGDTHYIHTYITHTLHAIQSIPNTANTVTIVLRYFKPPFPYMIGYLARSVLIIVMSSTHCVKNRRLLYRIDC